jgi:uncharacterized alpha-E superfamily protein
MLRYIKRRHVYEEEGSENQSKLSEPSMSKAEKEVTDKKVRVYKDSYLAMGFTWTGQKLPPSIVHCLREKLSNTAVVRAKLSRHFNN